MTHNTFPLLLSAAALAVSGCVVPAPDFVGSQLGCADGDGCPTGFSCDGGGAQFFQQDGLGVLAWGGVYACREVDVRRDCNDLHAVLRAGVRQGHPLLGGTLPAEVSLDDPLTRP